MASEEQGCLEAVKVLVRSYLILVKPSRIIGPLSLFSPTSANLLQKMDLPALFFVIFSDSWVNGVQHASWVSNYSWLGALDLLGSPFQSLFLYTSLVSAYTFVYMVPFT